MGSVIWCISPSLTVEGLKNILKIIFLFIPLETWLPNTHEQEEQPIMKAEKRQQIRIKLEGYSADIADGPFVYAGIVEDAITTV